MITVILTDREEFVFNSIGNFRKKYIGETKVDKL